MKLVLGLLGVGLKRASPRGQEESVKEFFVRHLGEEAYERIVDPFISGVSVTTRQNDLASFSF